MEEGGVRRPFHTQVTNQGVFNLMACMEEVGINFCPCRDENISGRLAGYEISHHKSTDREYLILFLYYYQFNLTKCCLGEVCM